MPLGPVCRIFFGIFFWCIQMQLVGASRTCLTKSWSTTPTRGVRTRGTRCVIFSLHGFFLFSFNFQSAWKNGCWAFWELVTLRDVTHKKLAVKNPSIFGILFFTRKSWEFFRGDFCVLIPGWYLSQQPNSTGGLPALTSRSHQDSGDDGFAEKKKAQITADTPEKRYCWRKKSCTSWYVVYPIVYRVLWDFFHEQYHHCILRGVFHTKLSLKLIKTPLKIGQNSWPVNRGPHGSDTPMRNKAVIRPY